MDGAQVTRAGRRSRGGLLALALAGVVPLTACLVVDLRDDRAPSETSSALRPLGSFDGLSTARGVSVEVHCGPATQVTVRADTPEGLSRVTTEIEGSTLKIRQSGWSQGSHWVRAIVETPSPLTAVSASSGSSVKVDGCAVAQDRLALEASSGASLHLAGHARAASVSASSGATIGPLRGQRLEIEDASVTASTGASVALCGAGRAQASASTGGEIILGRGARATTSTSLGGSVSYRETCD